MIRKRKDRVQKVQLYRASRFPPSVTTLDNIQSVSSPFEFVVFYDRLGSWTADNIYYGHNEGRLERVRAARQ